MEAQNPSFQDVYTEQATYLAEYTDLTEREAEAYLRRGHTPDNVTQSELARNMGIGKATFSTHLKNATEKLEGDTALANSLTTMLLTTDMGGSGGHNRQVIGAKKLLNAFMLVTETEFYDAERYSFPAKYKAHLIYREQEPDIDFDELPESTLHYDKHSVFTVQADEKEQLMESVVAYINALSELNEYDLVNSVNLLEDALGLSEHDSPTSELIREASRDIARNG